MQIKGTQLLFLTNELMNPRWQQELRVPLEFITFGFMQGKLYTHYKKVSTFATQLGRRKYTNDVVYGALFVLRDFHFYIRTIDAYMGCSQSTLLKNHTYDLHHRILTPITPITFKDIEEFVTLRYRESSPLNAYTYIGNLKHAKLANRLQDPHNRIVSGVAGEHFKELVSNVL